jgi:hypothetical protein
VWDIWRREDLKALRGYLTSHASEFQHCGQPVCMATLDDVIHSQVPLPPLHCHHLVMQNTSSDKASCQTRHLVR